MNTLEREVPSRELCEKMAAIPALAEAFKDTWRVWFLFPPGAPIRGELRARRDTKFCYKRVPAPTVQDMLEWLIDHYQPNPHFYQSSDPNCYAEFCIEAAQEAS